MTDDRQSGPGARARPAESPGVGADREMLARALRPIRALRELLEEERRALAVAEPRALLALAERKTHLLGTLEALQPELGEALLRAPQDDEERAEIIDCLEACREGNVQNGVVTATASHHVRSTLALLRSTLALDDLTLYDEHGELLTRRERRPLGSA